MKHLNSEQRLDIVRRADRLRKWSSLDDKRVCVMCERIFSGRQIEIVRDQRGRYLLQCPTPGCPSFAAHWFHVGNDAGPGGIGIARRGEEAIAARDTRLQ